MDMKVTESGQVNYHITKKKTTINGCLYYKITKTDEESFAPVPHTQKTLDMKDWLIAVFNSCKYKLIFRIPPNIFTDFFNRPLLKSPLPPAQSP
jgi:hypothetical protein